MDTSVKAVKALPDFQLRVTFQNGSIAVVNFRNMIRTIRFAPLASEDFFDTARAEGDKIIWQEKNRSMQIYCNELMDIMMK